jgi:catechol 2,3-dioxygenase-like lactoylglutathione lyase family enzyme
MNSLEWIILKTNSFKTSKLFYSTILQLPIVREVPEEEFCQFKLRNCFLAIYGSTFYDKLIGRNNSGKPGGAIYTFAEVSDVDATIRELKSKGVKILKEPKTQPWGQRTAYFLDPDSHIWEIQQWIKK